MLVAASVCETVFMWADRGHLANEHHKYLSANLLEAPSDAVHLHFVAKREKKKQHQGRIFGLVFCCPLSLLFVSTLSTFGSGPLHLSC